MIIGSRDRKLYEQALHEAAATQQELRTTQNIIQSQQDTIRRLQDSVDHANERYNELVKTVLSNQRSTIQMSGEMFEDLGVDKKKAEWLTPAELYTSAKDAEE